PKTPGNLVDGWHDGGLRHQVVKVAGSGSYPSPEQDVFTFLEGAYYGNLFKPANLRRSCQVVLGESTLEGTASDRRDEAADTCRVALAAEQIAGAGADRVAAASVVPAPADPEADLDACLRRDPTLPYKDVYACYSYAQQNESQADDDLSAATLNSRLCDLPNSTVKCFPHPRKRCHYKNAVLNTSLKSAGCGAIGQDGAYGHCPGEGDDSTVYQHVITTHLNEACDVLGENDLCNALRRTTG